MAWTWSRVDRFLNWVEHGWFVTQIVGSIGLGKLVEAMLKTYTRIPLPCITAIWWLSAATFLILLMWLARLVKSRKPLVIQTTTATEKGGVKLHEIEKFYEVHQGPLLRECEDSVREEVEKCKLGNEREAFLIRHLATMIVMAFFAETRYAIFGSQIRALERLNIRCVQN